MIKPKFQIGEIVWYTPSVIYAYEQQVIAIRDDERKYLIRKPNTNDLPEWVDEQKLTKKVDEI